MMKVMHVDHGHSRFSKGIIMCCQENAGLLQSKSDGWLLSQ
jgi:hypothetical protein